MRDSFRGGALLGDLAGGIPPQLRRVWKLRRRTVEDIAARDIAVQEAVDEGRLPLPVEPGTLPEPEPLPERADRFNMAALRLAGLGLALALAVGMTMVRLLVGGPPSVADLRAQSGVDGWPVLTVGVKDDQYGTAYYNEKTKIWSGFDIDIAYMIAEDLGFRRSQVHFYGMESEDRARMQANDEKGNRVPVKMVIASYSITPDRIAAGVTFSQPYLYTEQSVITLTGHSPVAALEDLRGQNVCTLSTSTSEAAPSRVGANVVRKNRVRECFAMLDKHEVDAVTTDAAILAGWKAEFPAKYAHWDLGLDATEAWGVNVGDNPALKKLVDLTLYRSYADPHDDRWENAFRNNLQVEVAENGKTPIAVAEQPRVTRPDVRQLPWEDPLG
ncbi:glutamate-binding protein [Actinoplanes sp. SE50]|uniref:transporter substrate-binding domain-containing protein n=1 Tax=unclassified Actinoplanes TaxID=2626549 RepID=UPI00023EC17F|nr:MULTISPECIES: transporter substrate-binding domain-containing protein [unclassified Actinoplanes]AEV87501.1 Membrane-bound lytic murein transglycosylase F [Actinoplanes sp. SE50/110]ATO85904.1 glutamate-binding protein [Actinoplanes sp. SE50]SLM03318.1 glutamate-binding protein [Actinoplanes sp. SE50/110]